MSSRYPRPGGRDRIAGVPAALTAPDPADPIAIHDPASLARAADARELRTRGPGSRGVGVYR